MALQLLSPRAAAAQPGSVAAIKVPELVLTLTKFAEVKLVPTMHARSFFGKEQLPATVNMYLVRSWKGCL